MRDGTKLHTVIFRPREAKEKLPILLLRTPYGADGWSPTSSGIRDLAAEGYVFVFQDIRGRHKSEGTFVMMRPVVDHASSKAFDEATDAYDTIDYLVKKVEGNNGNVGMFGISYDGWTTVMGMIGGHPALKAASPQSSPADMWLGDDFHHNGAFRLSYGFEYVALMETGKEQAIFSFDRFDTYDWYLRLGPLSHANDKYLHGKMPTWNDFVEHPDYDAFWQKQATWRHLGKVDVPTLNVTGWWDQEDYWGPLKIYTELEKRDSKGQNYLVVGPWNHGGWAVNDGSKLGDIQFGSATSRFFQQQIQAPFFAYYLKGKGEGGFAQSMTFNTGRNQWVGSDAWPPKRNVRPAALYLRADKGLSFAPPDSDGTMSARWQPLNLEGQGAESVSPFDSRAARHDDRPSDSYISDPASPVPYRPRPIGPTYPFAGWPTWLVQDQRFVDGRPDVLTYTSEPLKEDLTLAGPVTAKLWASTTGTDADWVVKLIDQYPDLMPSSQTMGGYQLMIASEVFRGRYRESFEKPRALEAQKPELFTIDLHQTHHTFLKGHRIVIQVQSSWFPVIDRNPQTFVPNIFKAAAADYRPATHTIWRSKEMPSRVEVSIQADGS